MRCGACQFNEECSSRFIQPPVEAECGWFVAVTNREDEHQMGRAAAEDMIAQVPVRLYLFDALYRDGRSLVDDSYQARWQALAHAGDWARLFAALMTEHYDPLYEQSMRRSYRELDSARRLVLADGGPAAMAGAARALWP